MRCWTNVVLMLDNRLRRWPNIKTTFDERLLFAGRPRWYSGSHSLGRRHCVTRDRHTAICTGQQATGDGGTLAVSPRDVPLHHSCSFVTRDAACYLLICNQIFFVISGHTHRRYDVAATLNQHQWRWFNVTITSCAQWTVLSFKDKPQ